jgi:hypothetical protein
LLVSFAGFRLLFLAWLQFQFARLSFRFNVAVYFNHELGKPGISPTYQTLLNMAEEGQHTASLEEANAARLPLGYRDQCSA